MRRHLARGRPRPCPRRRLSSASRPSWCPFVTRALPVRQVEVVDLDPVLRRPALKVIEETGRLSKMALAQKQRPVSLGMFFEQQRIVLEEAGARTERLAL